MNSMQNNVFNGFSDNKQNINIRLLGFETNFW